MVSTYMTIACRQCRQSIVLMRAELKAQKPPNEARSDVTNPSLPKVRLAKPHSLAGEAIERELEDLAGRSSAETLLCSSKPGHHAQSRDATWRACIKRAR
jgi:hypothetical protein